MTETAVHSRLLSLPWEIRRLVIVEVLKHRRKSEPVFDRELIESRVRLRNCFDPNFREVTNIYVPRRRNQYMHGNALRATNRQLRYETNLLIDEEIKSGNMRIPFVLDIMIVNDAGVFPTWMSFPYQPEHLKTLRINLRIVRPGTSNIPKEWIQAASYDMREHVCRNHSPTHWNIFVALVLYALGCFSTKADSAQTRDETDGRPSVVQEVTTAKPLSCDMQGKEIRPPRPKAKKSEPGAPPNLISHQSDMVNAYFLPSPSYVVDELVLDFKGTEYDANGKPIPPGVHDSVKGSRFYNKWHIQFGRELPLDSDVKWNANQLLRDLRMVFFGELTCDQLEQMLCERICDVGAPREDGDVYGTYLNVLANSVGEVVYSDCAELVLALVERHPLNWAYIPSPWADQYAEARVEEDLAEELARDTPDRDVIRSLCTVQTEDYTVGSETVIRTDIMYASRTRLNLFCLLCKKADC